MNICAPENFGQFVRKEGYDLIMHRLKTPYLGKLSAPIVYHEYNLHDYIHYVYLRQDLGKLWSERW